MKAPSGLPTTAGAYVRVDLTADHAQHASWKQPVQAYFVRQAGGWKLVGLERQVAPPAPGSGGGAHVAAA